MKRVPLIPQLTVILFCVMAIPIAFLTSYSGGQILTYSESQIAESSLAELQASSNLIENAMNNLATDAVRLTASNLFNQIRYLESYDEVNANYTNITIAVSVLRELANLNHRVDGVYSTYFYVDNTNYVISTDKGITKLEGYGDISWMEEALVGRRGISGVWYPRQLSSGVQVYSYVLPLSSLTTTTRGTLVVNLRESKLNQYLRSSDRGEQEYLLLTPDGQIFSHNNKELLYKNGTELPYMHDILANPLREGYTFHEREGERLLYAWSHSPLYGWTSVKSYSMDELMSHTTSVQRNIIFITIIIIVAGALITVLLATWLSRPVRKLVQAVRSHTNLRLSHKNNELAFLDAAFKSMQEEEKALHQLLQYRGQDNRDHLIQKILRGEMSEQFDELFPKRYILVAVLSIDRYRRYVRKNSPEARNYHRYLLIQKCVESFPDEITVQTVYQGEGCFALIINVNKESIEQVFDLIQEALFKIKDKAASVVEHTVTIGVSNVSENKSMLPDRLVEAMEAVKHRMIRGGGSVVFWTDDNEQQSKYIYPANRERRILNYLDSGDLDSITKELKVIGQEIREAEYISIDNILFIYNQLAGVTIRHLRENANTAKIFAGRSNIYSTLASFDTLDEIEEYLHDFYTEIVKHLKTNSHKTNHVERIIQYFEDHYHEDIVFGEMAKQIGISYSYMRKIVSEHTGKSLIDCLNQLRIQKSQQLLLESDLTIAQIAEMVGYHNVQSFNRFFRKYEGMSPGRYRSVKQSAAL